MTINKVYSKNILNTFLRRLSKKIFIYFYDLNPKFFKAVISKINLIFNIKEIEILNNEYLILFGYLDSNNINSLTDELDLLDIGEFEIAEYIEKNNIIELLEKSKYVPPSIINNLNYKAIYVNKDERIIQSYLN